METRTLMRTEDVAERLGVPAETIRYWRAKGRGPRWFKIGRYSMYAPEDVEAWIAEQRETTGPAAAATQPAAVAAPAPRRGRPRRAGRA